VKVSDLYPSKYLKGSDLGGRAVTVTIDTIALESFYDSESKQTVKKPVLYFAGKQKGLVLSKSLAYKLAEILRSDDMDIWPGGRVVLFTERRSVYGEVKEVFAVRAADPAPQPAAQGAQPGEPGNDT
jgi:hypothetical protein